MTEVEDKKIKHLYHRAGFGLDLKTWKEVKGKPLKKAIRRVLKGGEINLELSAGEMEDLSRKEIRMMGKEARQEKAKENRLFVRDLNVAWVRRMAFSQAQLREKMTLFWHDHFACRLRLYKMVLLQNNTLRNYSLGKFKDLLLAISKDPGMLQFLNNQQNRKTAPNENFARELLELFTLGRGHYTEEDVKETARAFTGWGFGFDGEFIFRRRQHDFGVKTFLGKKGNFDGEDIIDIILEQRQCARFLTRKIYRFFVNEEVDEDILEDWSSYFYEEEYDIGKLLVMIFNSDHFYASSNMGTRIKSPTEFLVGLMRHLDMDLHKPEGLIYLQKILGQVLFQPPNVAGWPSGRNWIDSTTLMSRLKIPEALVRSDSLLPVPKADFSGNEDIIRTSRRLQNRLASDINWEKLLETMAKAGSYEKAVEWTEDYLFSGPQPSLPLGDFKAFARGKEQSETMKWIMLRLLSTPEYQFC